MDAKEPFDFCAYIKQCTEHPFEKAPPITIGQYQRLVNHVASCNLCKIRVDEVLVKYPEGNPMDKSNGQSEN